MEYLAVILPSLCVGVVFYFVMKSIFNADRAEREALAEADRREEEERANL